MDEKRANLPLAGITVIDFGQIFQGPYATLLMAKAGAFVIKIEPPRGEPGRRRADPGKSATLPFAMLNQNKRAVSLNLKHPRGRELLFAMVRRADVLLETFRPGVMARLGLDYATLHARNPRLVVCSISGYGQDEDRRRSNEAGFDYHLVKPVDHDVLVTLLSHSATA